MKDKIHWTWKRIIGTILGILGIGTLTSCYGVPEDEFEYDIYGKVQGRIDGTTQPVKGIVVEAARNMSDDKHLTYTDSDGWFEFKDLYEGSYTVKFTDTDGAENGSFKQKIEHLSLTSDHGFGTVTLENDE